MSTKLDPLHTQAASRKSVQKGSEQNGDEGQPWWSSTVTISKSDNPGQAPTPAAQGQPNSQKVPNPSGAATTGIMEEHGLTASRRRTPIRHRVRLRAQAPLVDWFRQLAER